jgi:hypothetical protein
LYHARVRLSGEARFEILELVKDHLEHGIVIAPFGVEARIYVCTEIIETPVDIANPHINVAIAEEYADEDHDEGGDRAHERQVREYA